MVSPLLESSEEDNNHQKRKINHNFSSTPGVEEIQAKDTIVVLPSVKKSHLWRKLKTMVAESEEVLGRTCFGMIITLSRLLENFKILNLTFP